MVVGYAFYETIAKLEIWPATSAGVGFYLPGVVLRSLARVGRFYADCGSDGAFGGEIWIWNLRWTGAGC